MNELAQITQSAPKSVALKITEGLQKFFTDVEKEKEVIDNIVITKPDQVSEMKKAREIRLKIKNQRLEARDIVKLHRDNLKNAMSEFTLQDKLWLKAFQMLEATCDKLELDCEYKEKFAERYEAEQKQKRYESRVNQLHQFGTDPSIYALADMTDEAFEKLLANEKLAFDARIKAEKEAEQQRLEEQEKYKLIRDRQIEIAPYLDYLPDGIDPKTVHCRADEDYNNVLSAAKQYKKTHDEEVEALRIRAEKDRREKEAAEQALRKQREEQVKKEAAQKLAEETAQKLRDEEARKKLLAPDKEKLIELAQLIDQLQLPAVSSKEANAVVRATEEMLGKVTNYIREKSKAL